MKSVLKKAGKKLPDTGNRKRRTMTAAGRTFDYYRSFITGYFYFNIAPKLHISRNQNAPYAGKHLISRQECSELIQEKIRSNKPLMACRFGSDELNVTAAGDAYINNISRDRIRKYHDKGQIYFSAGVFPENTDTLLRFSREMMADCAEMDVVGVWYNTMEDYIIRNYGPKEAALTDLSCLEPWYLPANPWSRALKGKRVLVISPFVKSIYSQYQRREEIFPGTEILPEFDLQLLKAVISGGGQKDERFQDWFEALDYMYEKAMEIGFDVAILGCASYGFPLAARFKKAGKAAIQLGGATQLMFGIKGRRWDHHPYISTLFNDSWIRPSQEEHFADFKMIDRGCYW